MGRSERANGADRVEPVTLTGMPMAADWWRRVTREGAALGRRDSVLLGVLVMLSLPYGIASSLLLWLRALRPARADVPVISVGNIVAGGAGKTPLTAHLARALARDGRNVAVVSRGYGRSSRGTVVVSEGDGPVVEWRKAGDEPYLMALLTRGVGVVVSERRLDGVRCAVQKLGADAILLDDAFQHVGLHRDLDIVAVDAARPVGNGYLLPGGPLREHPLGIGRADVIVATRCDRAGGPGRVEATLGPLAPGAPIVETRMKPVEFWDVGTGESVAATDVRESRCLALSSIADPRDFERTLERLRVRLVGRLALPDHHDYSDSDVAVVVEAAREVGADMVITTEKDAVRLRPWRSRLQLVALGIELRVTGGEEDLRAALKRVL
jgi:tetraacyldisaccharide 4'-kinase